MKIAIGTAILHRFAKLQTSRVSYKRLIPLAGEPDAVFTVEDRVIGFHDRKITIRIYRANDQKALPAVVCFHGGGFFKGSIESHDRQLCDSWLIYQAQLLFPLITG